MLCILSRETIVTVLISRTGFPHRASVQVLDMPSPHALHARACMQIRSLLVRALKAVSNGEGGEGDHMQTSVHHVLTSSFAECTRVRHFTAQHLLLHRILHTLYCDFHPTSRYLEWQIISLMTNPCSDIRSLTYTHDTSPNGILLIRS